MQLPSESRGVCMDLRKWLKDRATSIIDHIVAIIFATVIIIPGIYFILENPDRFSSASVPLWTFLLLVACLVLLTWLLVHTWRGSAGERRAAEIKEPRSYGIYVTGTLSGKVHKQYDGYEWVGSVHRYSSGNMSLVGVEGPFCPECHTKLTDYAPFERWGVAALFGMHYWRCPQCGFKRDTQKDTRLITKEVRDILNNKIETRELGQKGYEISWE